MQIRCPHCHVVIELVDEVVGSDVTCPKCGSRVSSADATFLEPVSAEPADAVAELTRSYHAHEAAAVPKSDPVSSDQPSVPPEENEESRFGRFRLLKRLGRGSFGEVWLADDPKLQRQVALKFPRAGKQKNFHWEAQATARLRHPHIVTVFEVGEETYNGQTNWPYIASEYIPSQDLAKVLKAELEQGRALPPKRVAEICRKVAEALHTAHQAGVVHCDLKPLNILIDEHGEPHVMDFGLARRDAEPGFTLTKQGPAGGTPGYSSPEQWQGKDIDCRTDVWALGIILFELLTGERPFRAERDLKLLRDQILHDDPPPPSKLNSQVPADLDTLCLKCLAKDPTRRFPTAATLAEELRRFLHGEPIHSRPIPQWERAKKWCQRNPVVASLSAAVAFVLITGTAVSSFFWLQSESRNRSLLKETKRANAKADEARLNLYDGHMNFAQRNWDNTQVGLVLDSLEKTRPQADETDLRGFEWHYWDRLCRWSLLDLKGDMDAKGQARTIACVAFWADRKRLALASQYGTVKVWDTTSGQETLTLKGDTKYVTSMAISADGKLLASASYDGTDANAPGEVKLWDATSGQETLTLKGHTGAVKGLAFSANGKQLSSAGWVGNSSEEPGEIKVWDITSGQETFTLRGHTNGVESVAFSADGKRLASASDDLTVKLWDVASGQEMVTLKGHTGNVNCVTFSADGKRLASVSRDQTVKLWDVASGQEMLTLKGHTDNVNCVAFSADGKWLASASDDQTVKLWDVARGQETFTLKGHTGEVRSVAFSADGKRLVSADDTTAKVWDTTSRQEPLMLSGHTGGVWSVAFSTDGKRLASASGDPFDPTNPGEVKIWDSTSGHESLTLKGHTDFATSVAFNERGKRLASAHTDGTVKLWDTTTGKETFALKHNGVVTSVAFTADGRLLASASADGTVKLWDAISGQETLTLKDFTGGITSVTFSPDGKRLASGSLVDSVSVWEWNASREPTLSLVAGTGGVTSVAYSADGQWLVSAGTNNTVKIWDAMSGHENLLLNGHTDQVNAVTFSADGKRLASASSDGTVKLWDATNGHETLTLKGHNGAVSSVAFSADGKRLASASGDGTVKVWDARPWTPELRAEREALSVIQFLRDHDKPQSEWLNAVSSDQTLSEPVRQRALQFAREWK